jgi:hypothetical protein
MNVELNILGDRSSTRLKLFMASLLAFTLTLWAAVPASAQALSQGKGNLRVMTYNVYEGADLSSAFSAQTQQEFLVAVGTILANVQASNPPARAAAIAKVIGKAQPTLVSLQEGTEWDTCPTTDFQNCSAPPSVLYDLLNLVKDALQAQGYSYREVGRVTANSIAAPAITAFGGVIAFYTQRSAILARADIDPSEFQTSNTQSAQYVNYLPLTILGQDFSVRRAWISADVRFHGTSFRLIDTQLESFHPGVNYLQSEELISGPAASELPVVVAMDSNSPANLTSDPFYPTYANFIGNGFDDGWLEANPGVPGLTWSLFNPFLTQRLDLVLLRGGITPDAAALVGARPSDKTASGLWPSDHVGVAIRLKTED